MSMYNTMSLRKEAQRGKCSTLQGRNAKSAPNFCHLHLVICCFGIMCSPCQKEQNSQLTSTEQHFKPLATFLRVAVRPWCSGQILGMFFCVWKEKKNPELCGFSHFYSFFHLQWACVVLKQLMASPLGGKTEHSPLPEPRAGRCAVLEGASQAAQATVYVPDGTGCTQG